MIKENTMLQCIISVPPKPALSVYYYIGGSTVVKNIIEEGRNMYIDCTSPATVPDNNVTLTLYRDTQDMGCYHVKGMHMKIV